VHRDFLITLYKRTIDFCLVFKSFALTILLDTIARKLFETDIVSESKKPIFDLTLALKIGSRNLNRGEKGVFSIREWFTKWMKSRGLLKQLPQESKLKLPISSVL
jgi:hypothetical protein